MDSVPPDQSNGMQYFQPPPPLVNPPPQIFGTYADGSPIQPSLAGPMFGDDDILIGADSHDHGDAKRRRIARVRALEMAA